MDLKSVARQNFFVLARTIRQRREVLAAIISTVAEDSLIRFSEYSIHILKKTPTPDGTLYHIKVIDNGSYRCILKGPIMLNMSVREFKL